MSPTHAEPTVEPSDEWRALVRQSADLCRRDPAAFASSVRLSDFLVTTGMDRLQARREALAQYDPQVSGSP